MTPIRRKPVGVPEYLLEAESRPGERTRIRGMLWDGVVNATPDDEPDGPNPMEALLAAIVACLARNLRSVTDSAHVTFDAVRFRVAAARSDDPPSLTAVRLELAVDAALPPERVRHLVGLAVGHGTITRTLARAVELEIRLTVNGQPLEPSDAI